MTDATLPDDAPKPDGAHAAKPEDASVRKGRRVSAEDGDTFQTLKALWPYLWPHDRNDLKVRVILALFVLIIAKVINVGVPYLYKWATDALAGTPDLTGREGWTLALLGAPVLIVIAYGVARVAVMGFQQLRDALFAKVSMNVVRKLGQETFDHLHKLSLRFHLARRTGGLSRIIERGTTGIESVVRFTILSIFPTMIEFVLAAAVIAYQFDWRYLVVLLGMMVGYVGYTVWLTNLRIQIRRNMNEANNDGNSKTVDSLLNYETVKYFNNEGLESSRFGETLARYETAGVQTLTSLAWLNIGQNVIFTAGMTATMVMAAQGVMDGENTVGDFVLINALMIQLYQPLNFIGTVYREIKQGLTDIEALFMLLDENPEIVDAPGAKPLRVDEGRIVFEDVRFAYDAERPILKGLSFEVPAGKTFAIVGPSGAGKSTLSRLLYRFYEVGEGRIRIDDQDITDVQQLSLRRQIGMVPQDTVLFNDTIAYNIQYGRPDASHAEVVQAAKLAQIHDFILQLPDGYETEVGERGLKLSGGEKQRVAIARTILKAPPILILDEATSALDSYTELEIQEALRAVAEGRTTLVIAHRLTTIVDADQILVIEAGRLVERGTHDELLRAGGLYAGMWNRQREAEEAREAYQRTMRDAEGFLPGRRREDALPIEGETT